MHPKKWFTGFCALALIALPNGCGNNSNSPGNSNPIPFLSPGPTPPCPASLVSAWTSQVSLSYGMSTPVSVLNGAQTVDFARLNGLRTLFDIHTIATGTYTQAVVTLANPSIDYL